MTKELKEQLVWSDGTNTKTINILGFTHDRKTNSAAELTFTVSNKSGEYNYFFMPGNEIRLSYGIGQLPDSPQFTGFPVEVTGTTVKEITCIDYMGLLRYDYVKVDDTDNYDGFEVSAAIKKIIEDMDGNELTVSKSGTYPRVFITEADKIRYDGYENRLKVIADLNDLCYDETYSSSYAYHPLPYFFYVDGTTFYHVKQPYVPDTDPALTVTYADNLLESEPEYTIDYLCNKCTFLGAEYEDTTGVKRKYEGSHTDTSHKSNMRLFHVVKEDDTLESDGACKAAAIRYVQENRALKVRSSLWHNSGFDLVPGKSVIEIESSRYGLNGKYLCVGVNVNCSQGMFDTTFELSSQKSALTDFV